MKNDNKGFSLVELIVVVLIMGILAVALTPQVLKWVNNSRIANDLQARDSAIANFQTALTNEVAYGSRPAAGKTYTYYINKNGLHKDASDKAGAAAVKTGTAMPATATRDTDTAVLFKFGEYCGIGADSALDGIKTSVSGSYITVTINENGKVTATYFDGTSNRSAITDN